MFNVSKSYKLGSYNSHCHILDKDSPNNPCWGQVRPYSNIYTYEGHLPGTGSWYTREPVIIHFNSLAELKGELHLREFYDWMKKWPQLYRYDIKEIENLPGDVSVLRLRETLSDMKDLFSKGWDHIVIDTKLTMLMPGWYPCIPGWHCDDFDRIDGQPNLIDPKPAEHLMVVIGDCSLTSFLNHGIALTMPDKKDQNLYGVLHKQIESIGPSTFKIKSGDIYLFNQLTWHKGEAATKQGWRYFIRMTGSNHREPKNEIRTQSNVYLTDPFKGW